MCNTNEISFWGLRLNYKQLLKMAIPIYIVFGVLAFYFYQNPELMVQNVGYVFVAIAVFQIAFFAIFLRKVKIIQNASGQLEIYHFNKIQFSTDIKSLENIRTVDVFNAKRIDSVLFHFANKSFSYVLFQNRNLGSTKNDVAILHFIKQLVEKEGLVKQRVEGMSFKKRYDYKRND